VDLSGIIFVALAVAWAAYLIPKALKHHDEVVRSRSVDRFSHTMRVLARREPVSKRDARLVVTPSRAASEHVVETKAVHPTPAQLRVRRDAARNAARRRRRVLGLLLLANLAVVGVAALGVISWVWEAVPAGLVVVWLVACRLMVKKERAVPASYVDPVAVVEPDSEIEVEVARNDQGFDELDPANDTAAVPVIPAGDPDLWDPLPMTLPTYVNKPAAARRSVRTIALDDSGVWTSGRTEVDAQIAREADEQRSLDKADAKAEGDERAVGS